MSSLEQFQNAYMSLRQQLADQFVVVPTLCSCGVIADHEITACDNSMDTEQKVSNLSKHVSKLQCLLRGLSGDTEGSDKIKNEVHDLKIRLEAAKKAEIKAKNELFRFQTSYQNQSSHFAFPQNPFSSRGAEGLGGAGSMLNPSYMQSPGARTKERQGERVNPIKSYNLFAEGGEGEGEKEKQKRAWVIC